VVNLANAPRGRSYQQQRDQLLLKGEQRQQFMAAARQVTTNRLALGSLAELSIRLPPNTLAITAGHSHLASLTEADIITGSIKTDEPLEAAAPHLQWHRRLYRETAAEAVLLAHPPHALALANAGLLPDPQAMPAMWDVVGGAKLLPAAADSPDELSAAPFEQHVILLPHRAALIWGDSLSDVIARAEALEYLSQLTVIARQGNLSSKLA
jgi:ribulose-5-phosphate 4-epimerase/fuculose-1-phosphate aldolase